MQSKRDKANLEDEPEQEQPIIPGSPHPAIPATTAIEVTSLTKVYPSSAQPIRAVDNVNLSVACGQVMAFLGPNGAGKTTTIKMICGLISPTSGAIRLNGYDVVRQPRRALGQIGVVLEGARNTYWRLSAWENLLYFGRLRGCSGKTLRVAAEQLLRELGLWERRNDEVRLFSRGMQQKIAIASALVADPPILLLDEPTLGLDLESARVVERWVTTLAHERGKAVLLTTHQLDMAERVSDRVAIIRKGQLVADEPVADLLKLPQQPAYEVRLSGQLEKEQYSWLSAFVVSMPDSGTTIVSGIPDQNMLYGVLDHLRDLHVQLLGVTQNTPDLEDVFTYLLHQEPQA